MKRPVKFLIFGIIILLLIIFIILFIKKDKNQETTTNYNNFKINEDLKIDNCQENSSCEENIIVYPILEYQGKIKEIKKLVNKINKETKSNYQESLNSSLNQESCQLFQYTFAHSIIFDNTLNWYENGGFIAISKISRRQNICQENANTYATSSYIYDKEEQKILTNKELLKKINITESSVLKKIEKNIKSINNNQSTNYKLSNTYQNNQPSYNLFYDNEGILMISYLQKENNQLYIIPYNK